MKWYRVQIGAYVLKKNAENVCADLIEKGFKTVIAHEQMLYKVRIGSFQDKAKAEKLLARVTEYKAYKKAKILEWDDGKKFVPIQKPVDSENAPDEDTDVDKGPKFHPLIKFIGIWFTESCESKFGDAECFIEYDTDGKTVKHTILVDTGQSGTDTIKKLKKLGVKVLDAVVISHAHGDHYGYLSDILKEFKVLHLYLPGIDGLKKYQSSYAKAIQNQEKKAKKYGIPVTYLTTGRKFTIGHIDCFCRYQVPAYELSEKDGHHFVNNQSIATLVVLDGRGRVLLTGDLSNPGNKVLMKRVDKQVVAADIAKCGWHGDGNAMTTDWARFIGAIAWFWNYHHKESRGGRGNTRKKLEKAGVKHILRNFEDGDLTFAYQDGEWNVTTSKSKKTLSFKSRFA